MNFVEAVCAFIRNLTRLSTQFCHSQNDKCKMFCIYIGAGLSV